MNVLRLAAASLAATVAGGAVAGTVAPDLQAILADTPANDPVGVLVYLEEQVDLTGLGAQLTLEKTTLAQRHAAVVDTLQFTARVTQGDLAAYLADLARQGRATDVQAFWIVNAFALESTAAEIERLAARDDVFMVYPDYGIELVAPIGPDLNVKGDDVGGALGPPEPEPGVVAVRAPEVWAEGITGEGVLVATLDTGVDGNHPALASRWAGVADPRYSGHPEWAWFDPVTNTQFPTAFGSHGTHTMGSVCGGAPGDPVGVAPGATWIHAAVIDRESIARTVADAILSFEWMLDPDGNPGTFFDVPGVCSNSWGLVTSHGYPPCDETFWSFLDACEEAGTVILFSAGNEGSSGLRRPGDRATDAYRTLAVASVNANIEGWPISSFSSRGPTLCTPNGDPAIKPDIAAPGENVRSSVPGGGYGNSSGTSMASPHVNGVVALMRQACPDLLVEDIKQIIYDTAFDLGPDGEDNSYGWGMVDAYEAVQMAFDLCGPSPPRARDASYETAVDTALPVTLVATDFDGEPGGPLTYRIRALPADGNTLTDAGDGHVITPGDLPYDLVDFGNVVTYTPTGGFWGDDAFLFAADDGGDPPDGGEGEAATVSILVLFGPPVITTETLPVGYLDFAYGPVTLEAAHGQPELRWSVVEDEYDEASRGENEFEPVGVRRNWNADDDSWRYDLPFAFPYYEDVYTSVWVCSNGFLDFASSDADWSNSESELIENVRVAPMWDDIRTNCGGTGDIYIDDSVDGQVTIRWDGLLYNSSCTGNQVNLSVTLFEDGRMRFHYGGGNQGLTPTIGVSAGDGARYLLASYNNAGSLPFADTLEIFPPSPLPEGMTLGADGVLTGTPLEFGLFDPRVRVTDSLDRSDQRQFELEILESGRPGDVNGDGVVDTEDLIRVLEAWGPCPGCPEDVNGDGVVDFADLLVILVNWG